MTIPLPADLPYGYVDGSFVRAAADSADADRTPDGIPIADLTITITPTSPAYTATTQPPALVVKDTRTCTVNADGDLLDETGTPGVWLVTGAWIVNYSTATPGVRIKAHSINVTAEHTETSPLHLSLAYPPPGAGLEPSEYAVVMSRIDNLELGVTSWDEVTDKPAAYPPSAHASSHATGGTDPVTPEKIGAVPADDSRLYDSGWREISAAFVSGWTGILRVRRVGDHVAVRVLNLNGAAATSRSVAFLPKGFAPGTAGPVYGVGSPVSADSADNRPVAANGGTDGAYIRVGSSEISLWADGAASLDFLTSEPIPTTRPGTPA